MLRIPRESDLDDWAAQMAHPEAMRFLGGPQGRAAAWRHMATMVGGWHLRGCGFFSVLEKATGRWVGRVGAWFPEGWPGTEVGWGISAEVQRRGYATEAAAACIDWAFEALGWTEVIHCIDAENLPSIRVATKLGSRKIGHEPNLQPFGTSADIYGQTREEWAVHRTTLLAARDAGDRGTQSE